MLAQPLVSLVIPSRNESANMAALFQRLDQALDGIHREYILVDDSDDDTAEVARALSTRAELRVIHRVTGQRDGGLGGALRAGFQAARGTWVCVLDSDLQHPPEKVRDLLTAGEREGADLVIASRYVKGGSGTGLEGSLRKFVSRFSTILSRALLFPKLEGVADSGSGYYMAQRASIPLARYRPSGFKSLMELLVRGNWKRVIEVPYDFGARQHGQTKAGLREGMNYLRHLTRLFVSEPGAGRFWKFLIVGATGLVVNLGVLVLLLRSELPSPLAWLIAVEASILSNFSLHLLFTFSDRTLGRLWSALAYHGSVAIGVMANGAVYFGATIPGALGPLPAASLGIVAASVVNYYISDRVAFRQRSCELGDSDSHTVSEVGG